MEGRTRPIRRVTRRGRSIFTAFPNWRENTLFNRLVPVGSSCEWQVYLGKLAPAAKVETSWKRYLAKAKASEPLRLVDDIRMSPTYTQDAARALERLLREGSLGLFHLVNAGNCTWYEFASKALELAGMGNRIEPISSADYLMKARRPKNSSLESSKLNSSLKECLRPWEKALESYLLEKRDLSSSG